MNNDEFRTKQYELFSKKFLSKKFQKNNNDDNYVKPKFKDLTKEQVEDIHKRGKITPEEMVKEWEYLELCAPGSSSFNERCHCFRDCHDCLVDYASRINEYYSLLEVVKINYSGIREKSLIKKR